MGPPRDIADKDLGGFPVLFEDADVLAVCKPEGLATIAEREKKRSSLLSLLESASRAKLYIVHRLDKEVSGVILFAKNPAAHKWINDQFARREVSKTYLALVHGVPREKRGSIDEPIREFGSGRMAVDKKRGKPSVTTYEVVQELGRYAVLSLRPSTGRRHQLRVHLYALGHPVVGDTRYGEKTVQSRFPRLMLHAASVSLVLPAGTPLSVEAAAPPSFVAVLDAVARERNS